MKKVNIQGLIEVDDPFYRYQRQIFNVVSLKNKTQITNFDEVCKDIEREPKIVINFFKKKLGLNIIYKNSLVVFSNHVLANDLEKVLNEFIDKYVLCPICKLPETVFINNEKRKCRACSYTGI